VLDVRSATFGIRTRDVSAARDWYARVLGRPPDIVPDEGVYEWRLAAGAWLQLLAGEPSPPGTGELVRLGVGDIDAARAALLAAGARVSEVTTITRVVSFCDAVDPFGNGLSLYEDLTG
jgi:catechol 2,3-dioxygenase-like lactoylglutathione lyase family enzyme